MLFFFNDTATTEIYTLSLHDALPILFGPGRRERDDVVEAGVIDARHAARLPDEDVHEARDRKSTRLNSSHLVISYAVFCLKKKIARWLRIIEESVTFFHMNRYRFMRI